MGSSYFDVRENYSDFSYSLLTFAHTVEYKKSTKIRWSRIARGERGDALIHTHVRSKRGQNIFPNTHKRLKRPQKLDGLESQREGGHSNTHP